MNPVPWKQILYYAVHTKFIDLITFGKILPVIEQYILHNELAVRIFFKKTIWEDFTQILAIFFRETLSRPFTEQINPTIRAITKSLYTCSKDIITTTALLKNIAYSSSVRIQISATPIYTHIKISAASENDVFIINFIIILPWLNQNACGTRVKRMKKNENSLHFWYS